MGHRRSLSSSDLNKSISFEGIQTILILSSLKKPPSNLQKYISNPYIETSGDFEDIS